MATGNVDYQWHQSNIWYNTQNGDDQETHYPMGMMLDRFAAQGGPGLLLLHSPGNVFIRDLRAGQNILVQPSALIYKDLSVQVRLHFEYPGGTYWFAFSPHADEDGLADALWARSGGRAVGLQAAGDGRIRREQLGGRRSSAGSCFASSRDHSRSVRLILLGAPAPAKAPKVRCWRSTSAPRTSPGRTAAGRVG